MFDDRKSPYYIVFRSKRYSSRYGDIFHISLFSLPYEKPETIVGWFKIQPDVPTNSMRRLILENAESIIVSRNVVMSEVPIFITWNGEKFSDDKTVFGRMV